MSKNISAGPQLLACASLRIRPVNLAAGEALIEDVWCGAVMSVAASPLHKPDDDGDDADAARPNVANTGQSPRRNVPWRGATWYGTGEMSLKRNKNSG